MTIGIGGAVGLTPAQTGQTLFTTVVTTDAELVAALSSPTAGDTFIVAGSYTVDVSTLVIDPTPRTIWGAGMENVTITLIASAGPGAIDFGASQTFTAGVTIRDLTFTSAAAAVGPGLLMGVFSAENVRCIGTPGVTANGFFFCFNLVDCVTVDCGTTAFGAAYFACLRCVNCFADAVVSNGFFFSAGLDNCHVVGDATVGVFPDDAAYNSCINLTTCSADYFDTTVVATIVHGYFSCNRVVGCEFAGPSGGFLASLEGYTGCVDVSGCIAQRPEIGIATSASVSGCRVEDSGAAGYESNAAMSGCDATTSGTNGFFACTNVSGCRGSGSVAGPEFNLCLNVVGCDAVGSGGHGFSMCEQLAGVLADGNGGNGFNACIGIASANATMNTGFGYGGVCDRISSARGAANTAGLSDATNTAPDPVTAAGI